MIIHQKIIFKRRNNNCNKKDRQMKINLKENSLLETKTNNTLHIPTREEFHRQVSPLIDDFDFNGRTYMFDIARDIIKDHYFDERCKKNYENSRRFCQC